MWKYHRSNVSPIHHNSFRITHSTLLRHGKGTNLFYSSHLAYFFSYYHIPDYVFNIFIVQEHFALLPFFIEPEFKVNTMQGCIHRSFFRPVDVIA